MALGRYIVLILLVSMPAWSTNTYINTYKGKDVNTIKADVPADSYQNNDPAPTNILLNVGTAWGGNTYSSNYSIGGTLLYKFTNQYSSGLSFYLYSYFETYSKSAPQASNWVDPHSSARLNTGSMVLGWVQEYKVTNTVTLFSQVGLPLGQSHNTYDAWAYGFDSEGNWINGEVKGVEDFNGLFTMDLGFKYYFSTGWYVGSQYRLFIDNIHTTESILASDGSLPSDRTLKAGHYRNNSLLLNVGYTFGNN